MTVLYDRRNYYGIGIGQLDVFDFFAAHAFGKDDQIYRFGLKLTRGKNTRDSHLIALTLTLSGGREQLGAIEMTTQCAMTITFGRPLERDVRQ